VPFVREHFSGSRQQDGRTNRTDGQTKGRLFTTRPNGVAPQAGDWVPVELTTLLIRPVSRLPVTHKFFPAKTRRRRGGGFIRNSRRLALERAESGRQPGGGGNHYIDAGTAAVAATATAAAADNDDYDDDD
jgi:hypothetical protein